MKKFKVDQFPKNKQVDISKLNEYQIVIRNNQKKYIYGKEKTCNKCFIKQPVNEFYIRDKKLGRRNNSCRDCQMKNAGVVEIGKQRFSDKILSKGFRRCSVCKNIKPINEYSKSKSKYGGHSSNCYECCKSLHYDFMQKQQTELTDYYVKQYALRNYNIRISDKQVEKYRLEIIESRKPKYFLDDKSFFTLREFATYIESEYGNPITTTEKRISQGDNEKDCILSQSERRSNGQSHGRIKVTDTTTKEIFFFKNSQDKLLLKMFSKSSIVNLIRSGKPSRITKLSKYKNPCIVERVVITKCSNKA